jgi:2-keto-4-pentenoate hydratase/2-oxohepta-3-ene-1,7-dioic acid hydratase in catechol pathway
MEAYRPEFPKEVKPGDILETEVQGIGVIRNPIVAVND